MFIIAAAVALAFPVVASDYFTSVFGREPQPVFLAVEIDGLDSFSHAVWQDSTIAEAISRLQQEKKIALVYAGDNSRSILPGETISLQTWEVVMEAEHSLIPYEVHANFTSNVWYGDSRVRQMGVAGEHTITMEVGLLGGLEIGREVISEGMSLVPIDKIIDIGTARLGALADVTAPDFHYFQRIRMEATAYTAYYCCTDKHPDDPWFGITASGRRVEHGIVAVDRNVIPLGTRLYVEGYGFAIAADVGGAIRGNKIDLYMYRISDALQFGRRHLYVWVLDDI